MGPLPVHLSLQSPEVGPEDLHKVGHEDRHENCHVGSETGPEDCHEIRHEVATKKNGLRMAAKSDVWESFKIRGKSGAESGAESAANPEKSEAESAAEPAAESGAESGTNRKGVWKATWDPQSVTANGSSLAWAPWVMWAQ